MKISAFSLQAEKAHSEFYDFENRLFSTGRASLLYSFLNSELYYIFTVCCAEWGCLTPPCLYIKKKKKRHKRESPHSLSLHHY